VIGHRGASACAPENTLAALRKAKSLGCRWVEFDVRLTADDEPVLLHDDRLDRTTNGHGKASVLPLATVRGFDAGSWFGAAFAQERVPTLEEAIAVLAEVALDANIELKAKRGREEATGTVVADFLVHTEVLPGPMLVISSFRPAALSAAAARAPEIPRGMLFQAIPRNWRSLVDRFSCATVHAAHERLHPAVVSEIREAGYPLLAYTVNDPERAQTLFDWGVTSVFSDAPQCLQDVAAPAGLCQPMIADPAPGGIPRQGSGS
jgi:glycerophosphoryl diester phosphodiesterase